MVVLGATAQEVQHMGLMDKIKGMVSGNKGKAKQGVDTGAAQAKKVAPDAHDAKVDKAAGTAKDQIDKLD
jgi:hypothetical protein